MDLKSINDIFTKRILRIPSYQRGYSWSNNKPLNLNDDDPFKNVTGQLKDIWDDIDNIKEDSWHYTGLLTLAKAENEYNWLPNHQQYNIVDGQQRITTILIFIQVLVEKSEEQKFEYGIRKDDTRFQYLNIENDAVDAYIFGYDTDNPSDKFFKKWILNTDIVLNEDKESIYTENLKRAKDFFKNAVQFYCNREAELGISEEASLKTLFKKITSQLKLNEYILPKEELNEHVVFETMNNRGKPLSELEKLKNRLMHLNEKLPLYNSAPNNLVKDQENELLIAQRKQLAKDINTAWTTIYQSLGANKQKPLNDEEFVKNHWIIYFNEYDRSESNVYSNFLFDDFFTINQWFVKNLGIAELVRYG